MLIQENVSLKSYNSFHIDVSARYFSKPSTVKELIEVLSLAREMKLKRLILGGGSNILFTQDFDGIVILLELKGIRWEKGVNGKVLVRAKAGENWHQFVVFCLNKNYGGLENLSLIPGTVGAAPIQNIGAYGVEIKDVFHSCEVLDLDTFQPKTLYAEDCRFSYRDSVFKNSAKNRYVILEVCFKLTLMNHTLKTSYGAIGKELDRLGISSPNILDVSSVVISIRREKLPDPKTTGNAGSFFKNPVIERSKYEKIKHLLHEAPVYPDGENVKIAAGWLVEACGWRGKVIGNVGCHRLQSLVIINATGKATGKEVLDFSSEIISSVEEKFQIQLEREVNVL